MIYLFDKYKKLKGTVRAKHTIALLYERERNGIYSVSAEIPVSLTDKRTVYNYHKKVKGSEFIGHYDREGRFQLHKIAAVDIENTSIFIKGIHLFFDEAKAGAILREHRFRGREIIDGARVAFESIGWSVADYDISDEKDYSFYNISPLEARAILVETFGYEFDYWLDFDGKNLRNKQIAVKRKIGKETNKRYNYGHNVLSIKVEQDYSEIYTAVIGRGKGEELEDSDGHGRRIEFTDVVWKTPNNPLDKPIGSRTLTDPNATELFGYHDGNTVSPRTKVVIFPDIENETELLQASYDWLMDNNVPKAVFSLNVPDGDGLDLGDSVHVIYRDIDLIKSTRVTKVIDDLVSGNRSVEFGDTAYFETDRRISNLKADLKRAEGAASSQITLLKEAFDKRFDDAVQQWRDDFEQALIDAHAEIEAMEHRFNETFKTEIESFKNDFNDFVQNAYELSDSDIERITNELQSDFDGIRERLETFENEDNKIWDKMNEILESVPDVSEDEQIVENLNNEISELKGEIDEILKRPEKERESIQEDIKNEEQRLEELRLEIELNMQKRIDQLTIELEQRQKELADLIAEYDADETNRRTELEELIANKEAEILSYQSVIAERLRNDIKQKNNLVNSFIELINEERNKHISRLKNNEEIDQNFIDDRLQELQETIGEKQSKVDDTNSRKHAESLILDDLENKLNEVLQQEIGNITRIAESRLDRLNRQIEDAREVMEFRYPRMIAELERLERQRDRQIAALQEELAKLRVTVQGENVDLFGGAFFIDKNRVRENGRYVEKNEIDTYAENWTLRGYYTFVKRDNISHLSVWGIDRTDEINEKGYITVENPNWLEFSINNDQPIYNILDLYHTSGPPNIDDPDRTSIERQITELQNAELTNLNYEANKNIYERNKALIEAIQNSEEYIQLSAIQNNPEMIEEEAKKLDVYKTNERLVNAQKTVINDLEEELNALNLEISQLEEEKTPENIERYYKENYSNEEKIKELESWEINDLETAKRLNDREKYVEDFEDVEIEEQTESEFEHSRNLEADLEELKQALESNSYTPEQQKRINDLENIIADLQRQIRARTMTPEESQAIEEIRNVLSRLNLNLSGVSNEPTADEKEKIDSLNEEISNLNGNLFEVRKRINPILGDIYEINQQLAAIERTQDGEIRKLVETNQTIDEYSRRLVNVETTQSSEIARVGKVEHSVNGITGQFKELTNGLNNPDNPVLKQLDITAGNDGFYVRNTKVMDGQTMAGYLMADHNQVSAGIRNALTENDVTINDRGIRIGSKSFSGSDIASSLVVSPEAIDLISKNVNVDGNLNVLGTIRTEAIKAAQAEIGEASISRLNSDVIETRHLQANSITGDKISVDRAFVQKLISNSILTEEIRTLSLNAVNGNISNLRTQLLTSNVIQSHHIQSSAAMIDKLFANEALINRLTSKTAFIRSLQAIDISAAQVQVAFNNVARSVRITGDGLETYNGADLTSRLNGNGVQYHYSGQRVGTIGTSHISGLPNERGIRFSLAPSGSYMAWSYTENEAQTTAEVALMWSRGNGQSNWGRGFTFNDDVEIAYSKSLKIRNIEPITKNHAQDSLILRSSSFGNRQGVMLQRFDTNGAGIHIARDVTSIFGNSSSVSHLANTDFGQNATRGYIRSYPIYNWTTSRTDNSVVMDHNGYLLRSTSSKRYKYHNDFIDFEIAKKILDLNPARWHDKNQVDEYARFLNGELSEKDVSLSKDTLRLYAGVYAEDVEELGLSEFVSYDDEGRPDGIMGTLWTLLIPIVREQQKEIERMKGLLENGK